MSAAPLLDRLPLDFVARVYSHLTVVLLIPVSITIFAVVWGVENLTPLYANKNESPLYLVAGEEKGSSSEKKFQASIFNALAIIAAILVATTLIVILYKLRCIKVIIGWLLVSAALIFFFLFWIWLDLVFTKYQVPYDLVSIIIVLWNFGIVGLVSIFYYAHPKMQQGYLVVLSVIMGWMLSRLPEWTTWAILIAVALYDIFAVLCPNGPLKMLVEESKKRDEPIPGFVYDSTSNAMMEEGPRAEQASQREGSPPARRNPLNENEQGTAAVAATATATESSSPSRTGASPATHGPRSESRGSGENRVVASAEAEESDEEEPDPFDAAHLASPFRLGLGDFIFYSLLVARAAYFSYVTWMFSYICVSMGLIGTLCSLLFLRGKVPALPALPISIFLGVIGFFLSRFVVVPFVYFMIRTGHVL